ncbi:hypothetical protein JCM3766R1_005829 [Sporobolomyces carnicolor]
MDPKTPTEVTLAEVTSSTPDSPSDSAPPPSQESRLPARTYLDHDMTTFQPRRVALAYAPNSSVPRFVRALATLVFLGGSISALIAWAYKKIVVPRLVLALEARVKLVAFDDKQFATLARRMVEFATCSSRRRLAGGTNVAVDEVVQRVRRQQAEQGQKEEEEDDGVLRHGKVEGDASMSSQQRDESVTKREQPVVVEMLEPLSGSLSSLSKSFSSSTTTTNATKPTTSTTLEQGSKNLSNLVRPQGQLMRSFVTLNEYFESETYSISSSSSLSNSYRNLYGSSGSSVGGTTSTSTTAGGGAGERKALHDATVAFKAEIRSIKGALLNRRNFVRPEIMTS